MSVREIEAAVTALSREDLTSFQSWFDEFLAEAWDRRVEDDARAGRLDGAMAEADREFEAGRCTPL